METEKLMLHLIKSLLLLIDILLNKKLAICTELIKYDIGKK